MYNMCSTLIKSILASLVSRGTFNENWETDFGLCNKTKSHNL